MKKITSYGEVVYVKKNDVVKMDMVEAEFMPKCVHQLSIRMGKCRFTPFDTVANAFDAEAKSTATKIAATKVKNSKTIEDANKHFKSVEKNFNFVKACTLEATKVEQTESEGLEEDLVVMLLNAVEAAHIALIVAQKAYDEAKAAVDVFGNAIEEDEEIAEEESYDEEIAPSNVSNCADEIAKKHDLTELKPPMTPKYFRNSKGELFIWLPESKVFISFSPMTDDEGNAYRGRIPDILYRIPNNYAALAEKFGATVPNKEQLDELATLFISEAGVADIQGLKAVMPDMRWDNQMYVDGDGDYYTYGNNYYYPKTILDSRLECRKVLS